MEKVAVIILNYKTWKQTVEEIQTMKSQPGVRNCDYIVVDNCSPNDSYEKLNEYKDSMGYCLIKNESNDGYAKGNNIGLRYAQEKGYRYAWIMNNDILFPEKFDLEKLLSIFAKAGDIAVVNPDVYAMDGRLFNRDAKRWTIYDLTVGMKAYQKKGREVKDQGGWAYVYRPQGCSMILDIEKCSRVGFLDEHTFLYCEEPILAERLLAKNYRCAVDLDNNIIHNHSTTVRSSYSKKRADQISAESFKYYLEKYRKFNAVQVRTCLLFHRIKSALFD